MKRSVLKAKTVKAYVRDKLQGYMQRQAAREKLRKEGRPANPQARLFE